MVYEGLSLDRCVWLKSKKAAEEIGFKMAPAYKLLYRIYVKMKEPKIIAKAICGCGEVHTFEDWQKCPTALVPLKIKNDFKERTTPTFMDSYRAH